MPIITAIYPKMMQKPMIKRNNFLANCDNGGGFLFENAVW